MPLPELEEFTSMIAQSKTEEQSWGALFEMVRSGQHSEGGTDRTDARKYLFESGLLPVLSEWDFHSSPVLDQAALELGVKSWQLTEFIETVREMFSIEESDLNTHKDTSIREELIVDGIRLGQLDSIGDESDELIWISPKETKKHRQPVLKSDKYNSNSINTQLGLLWILVGFLISLLLVFLNSNRFSQSQVARTQASPDPTDPTPSSLAQDRFKIDSSDSPSTQKPQSNPQSSLWEACEQDATVDKASPQPGETWWPVVGPAGALREAKLYCRSDAFVSLSTGKVQISSFRDHSVAARFAELLTSDNSHPWSFEVGPPRVIGGR